MVEFNGPQAPELLSEWQWLMPEQMKAILVSTLGDAFLQDTNGAVHWLDAGAARLTRIAESVPHFNELRQIPENTNNWFMPQLIGDLMTAGLILGSNQVFSYKVVPTLNGKYEPANFEPADISVHFTMLGSLQRKIKDLPDGSAIEGVGWER
jgi:hypothetical protein